MSSEKPNSKENDNINNIIYKFESNNYSWRTYRELEVAILSDKETNPCYLLGIPAILNKIDSRNRNYSEYRIKAIEDMIRSKLLLSKLNL